MLPGMYLPRGGGVVPVTFSLVDTLLGVNNKVCNLGLSQADRKIVVIGGGDATSTTTCTVNSVAATSFLHINNASERIVGFFIDIGVGVTSATVSVSNNGATASRNIITVWAVYGAAPGAPAAVNSDSANANPTVSLTLGDGGAAIGLVYHRVNSNFSYTPSGLTEESAFNLQNSAYDGSAVSSTTGGTKTVTPSGTGQRNPLMSIATFNPA